MSDRTVGAGLGLRFRFFIRGGSASEGPARAIGVLAVLALLGGCAGSGGDRDGQPMAGGAEEPGGIPDAVPRIEPKSRYGNPESYVVYGKRYRTRETSDGFVERGLASWYGKKFHGRRTSSGERYDMHAMTAAHKTLPLPTYVRITNLENGKTAVVRVNDRGPFHGKRVIDLSYAAATKLGVLRNGTALVEVRALDPAGSESNGGASPSRREPGPFLAAESDAPGDLRSDRHGGAASKARAARTAARETDRHRSTRSVAAPPARTDSRAGEDLHERATDKTLAAVAEKSVGSAAHATAGNDSGDGRAKDSARLYLQVGAFGDPGNAERLRRRLVSQIEDRVVVKPGEDSGPILYKVQVGPVRSESEARRLKAKLVDLGVSEPRRVWN